MDSRKNRSEVAAVAVPESKDSAKGKAVTWGAPISTDSASTKAASLPRPARWGKGVAITDFVLRLGVIGAAMGAAVLMGHNEEYLPFFTQFVQFHAQWSEFPMFQYFVVANGVISGYAVLSLPFSYVCIVRPYAVGPRLLLIIFDVVSLNPTSPWLTKNNLFSIISISFVLYIGQDQIIQVMMGLLTTGASAAAAIVYLSHNGSQGPNWMAICQEFAIFCQTGSEAVVLSFVAAVFFMCLVPLSALALKRN